MQFTSPSSVAGSLNQRMRRPNRNPSLRPEPAHHCRASFHQSQQRPGTAILSATASPKTSSTPLTPPSLNWQVIGQTSMFAPRTPAHGAMLARSANGSAQAPSSKALSAKAGGGCCGFRPKIIDSESRADEMVRRLFDSPHAGPVCHRRRGIAQSIAGECCWVTLETDQVREVPRPAAELRSPTRCI